MRLAHRLLVVLTVCGLASLVAVGADARLHAPSAVSGGGGGGCPGPACDAEYLRLDATNDPMLAPLTVDDGDATNPGVNFGTGIGAYYTATDPYFGGAGLVVGEGLTTAGARGTLFTHFGGVDYTVSERFEAVGPTSATYSDYSFASILTDCADAATCAFGILVENSVTTDYRLQLVTSATKAALFDDDATTTPNIAYEDDTNTGLGRTGTDAQCLYANGICALAVDVNQVTVGTGVELWIQNGSAGGPSLAWTADTDTGFFRISSGSFGVSTNGTQRWSWSDTGHTSTVPIILPTGAVGTPSLTFSGDLDTGIYQPSANAVSVSAGGADVFAFTTTNAQTLHVRPKTDNVSDLGSGSFRYANGFIESVQSSTVAIGNGTAGAPSLTLSSEASGLYRPSAGVLGVSVGGNLAGAFGTDATFGRGLVTVGYLESPAIVNTPITPAEAASISCASGTLGSILTATDGTDAETCICGLRSSVYDWEPLSGATCSFF